MNKLLYVGIFIILAVTSFWFWPVFRYETTCDPTVVTPINAGCSAAKTTDYSDVKFRGGLTWLEQQNICIKTGEDCKPTFPVDQNTAHYDTPTWLLFTGSAAVAALATWLVSLIWQKFKHTS